MTQDIWRQGFFIGIHGISVRKGDEEYYDEQEKRMVFRKFTLKDEGRSRERIAVFENSEDAERAVEAVNAIRWRDPAIEPFPTDIKDYPIQICGPDYVKPSIAYNPGCFDKYTKWCPMAPIPKKGRD